MPARSSRGRGAEWDDRGVSTDGAPRIRVMARADVDLAVEWAAGEAGMAPVFETARMYAGPPPAIPLGSTA